MKKILLVAAIAVVVVVMAGNSYAAGSVTNNTISLSAAVTGKCSPIVPGSLTIVIDPATGTATSSGTDTTVQCSKNMPTSLVTVNGIGKSDGTTGSGTANTSGLYSGFLVAGSGKAIGYTLAFSNTFTGNGFGANPPTTLINASSAFTVDPTTAYLAEVATYGDTITVTVAY